MMRCFFFGTLLDRDLLVQVLDRPVGEIVYRPARLSGYRVVRLKDEVYPMLAADPASVVAGAVVDGIDDVDLARILFYESVEFAPMKVSVETDDGNTIIASAFAGSAHAIPGARPWSFAEWQRDEKATALLEARVWMAFYGRCEIEIADRIWEEWRGAGNSLVDLEAAIPNLFGAAKARH